MMQGLSPCGVVVSRQKEQRLRIFTWRLAPFQVSCHSNRLAECSRFGSIAMLLNKRWFPGIACRKAIELEMISWHCDAPKPSCHSAFISITMLLNYRDSCIQAIFDHCKYLIPSF
jgi:hypothetical protein